MLPFLVSKAKILQVKGRKPKEKNQKERNKGHGNLETSNSKTRRVKNPLNLPQIIASTPCECTVTHVNKIIINYARKSRKRGASNIVLSVTSWDSGKEKRMRLPNLRVTKKLIRKERIVAYDSEEFFKKLEVIFVVNRFLKLRVSGFLFKCRLTTSMPD